MWDDPDGFPGSSRAAKHMDPGPWMWNWALDGSDEAGVGIEEGSVVLV